MTLMDAQVGQQVFITKILEGCARRRLLDFGFTKGAKITVCNIAPFGGTVLVSIRGYTVALRENAGNLIEVSLESNKDSKTTDVLHDEPLSEKAVKKNV